MKKILIFFIFCIVYAALPQWYYKIKNIKEKKEAFISIMTPLIQSQNQKILKERIKILSVFKDPFFLLNPSIIAFLAKEAKKYKIKDILDKEEFLKRVDTIPLKLALAQAIVESGWGSSRFTKEANNLFGHWEYSNKGLLPKSRYDNIDINYSIKIFPSLSASIAAYMKNLNTNPAYKEFRQKRYLARKRGVKYSPYTAAKTLINYSQRKEEYVKLLEKIISSIEKNSQ
ncbi:MAG: mannosyl-glycoprotein endo-beta-N-acetylglucosamidase [Epsilonproteobacteria bacterium]|nr:mannosyl-glycoprotein endo-beta-N-acetylglucosamidase [Campylobacterota bacterium]